MDSTPRRVFGVRGAIGGCGYRCIKAAQDQRSSGGNLPKAPSPFTAVRISVTAARDRDGGPTETHVAVGSKRRVLIQQLQADQRRTTCVEARIRPFPPPPRLPRFAQPLIDQWIHSLPRCHTALWGMTMAAARGSQRPFVGLAPECVSTP